MRNFIFAIAIISILFLGNACTSADGNNPGTEYMPDMFHSIAYEANVDDYYYYNTWGTEQEHYKISEPRKPVEGTIPRGYAGAGKTKHLDGTASTSAMAIPVNGSVPYYYADTEEERTRATAEIINNPFPITNKGIEDAKELYDTFCGICHGEKGDGAGYLYDSDANPNAVYPAAPANFLTDEFVAASNGRYYHAIMHGKNVMGGYADKLSYEERWQVIHYIRSLQAKDRKLEYNEQVNTLNEVDVPKASSQYVAQNFMYSHTDAGHHDEAGQMGGPDHGQEHGIQHGDGHLDMTDHTDGSKEKKGLIKKIKDKVEDIKEKKADKKAAKQNEKDAGH